MLLSGGPVLDWPQRSGETILFPHGGLFVRQ
jgi:hypothetical protein